MTDLTALIDRLREAEEMTARLFWQAVRACGVQEHDDITKRLWQLVNAGAWTDAVLCLIPEGWTPHIFQQRDGTWFCRLKRWAPYELVAPFESYNHPTTSVASQALALLITILEAERRKGAV